MGTGYRHTCAILSGSGKMECWGSSEHDQCSVPSQFNRKTLLVAIGHNYNCATREMEGGTNGSISAMQCWGSNMLGQTNVPSEME
mmetsp:Transcript_26733/g.22475  ORF Transcript_26733/g.22475 Transcript_26733/m.22475 type:complete len:85 (+) Transcript_26733:702-956(+)